MYFVFFFQAEDGIRDYKVTGVQTCALPISARPAGSAAALDALLDRLEPHRRRPHRAARGVSRSTPPEPGCGAGPADRKSTRLNSSHLVISYAVFCLKKKNKYMSHHHRLRAR